MTIRHWLKDITEPIEAIVFQAKIEGLWEREGEIEPYVHFFNKFLSLEEAAPILDLEFCDGFGLQESYPVTIWTATKVYFTGEYDGSEWLEWVYRHPTLIYEPTEKEIE